MATAMTMMMPMTIVMVSDGGGDGDGDGDCDGHRSSGFDGDDDGDNYFVPHLFRNINKFENVYFASVVYFLSYLVLKSELFSIWSVCIELCSHKFSGYKLLKVVSNITLRK